jgi:hypothetical protein
LVIDWNAVSSVATASALVVSTAVFRVQLADRRRMRADQERAQAEHVAGWMTFDGEKKLWTGHIRNGSTQPVYDVVCAIRDSKKNDIDVAMAKTFR